MAVLDDTFGAVLIGVVIAAVLYGFTCVQTWYYYTTYPSDLWYIKLMVAAIFVSDTCHQVVITHVIYTYLVTFFGESEELGKIVWSMIVEVFFNGFTTLVVQCFLAMRVYTLSKGNWVATISIMVLVVAEFIAVVVFGIKALRFDTYEQLTTLKALSMTVNVLAAAGDILIAALLCCMLLLSRTGFRKSDTLINKLVVFSINTGLLTSLCALASLISITVWPTTFIYIAFYFCIGRLYCNSLLATLNARKRLRGDIRTDDLMLSFQGSGTQPTSTDDSAVRSGMSSKNSAKNLSIKINTAEECVPDEHSSPCDTKIAELV